MCYLARYEVPPPPTAPAGTDEREYQESARRLHMTFFNPSDHCWYCGNPLPCRDLVMWAGIGSEIWLHAECAVTLGTHLARDGSTAYHSLEVCT